MELDSKELTLGKYWLFGAGLFAIAMSLFVFNVDIYLNNSDAEEVRGTEMNEVRVAQAHLGTGQVDPRLSVNPAKMNKVFADQETVSRYEQNVAHLEELSQHDIQHHSGAEADSHENADSHDHQDHH